MPNLNNRCLCLERVETVKSIFFQGQIKRREAADPNRSPAQRARFGSEEQQNERAMSWNILTKKIRIAALFCSFAAVKASARPSGRRRECAVQAFSPKAKTLAEGRLCRPRALKSRRAETAFGGRSPKRKDILSDVLSFWSR